MPFFDSFNFLIGFPLLLLFVGMPILLFYFVSVLHKRVHGLEQRIRVLEKQVAQNG